MKIDALEELKEAAERLNKEITPIGSGFVYTKSLEIQTAIDKQQEDITKLQDALSAVLMHEDCMIPQTLINQAQDALNSTKKGM